MTQERNRPPSTAAESGRRLGVPSLFTPRAKPQGLWSQSSAGQGLVEYALILALIAVVAIVALSILGLNISEILSRIGVGIGG